MRFFAILLATLCVMVLVEGRRLSRQEVDDGCCYPRPPAGRALKRELRKCSEFPANDIWENFQQDIQDCKERRRQEQEVALSNSTSPQPPPQDTSSPPTFDLPAEKDSDNEFEADLDDEDDVGVPASPTTVPEVQTADNDSEKRKGRFHHKGRGHGKYHRGKGICVKEALEKRGWAKDGVVDYDSILKSTETAFNESASPWIPVVKEAITNCSKAIPTVKPEGERESKHHGCGKGMTPEKQAWRCIVNNSILKSPTFLRENEYCAQLQTAHDQCLEMSVVAKFKWCGSPRSGNRPNRPNKQAVA